jgi:hypothetical protein
MWALLLYGAVALIAILAICMSVVISVAINDADEDDPDYEEGWK